MIRITCPNCGADHDLPEGSLGDGGRNVRCRDCREIWLAKAKPDFLSKLDDSPFTADDIAAYIRPKAGAGQEAPEADLDTQTAPLSAGQTALEIDRAAAAPPGAAPAIAPDFAPQPRRRPSPEPAAGKRLALPRIPMKLLAACLALAALVSLIAGRNTVVAALPQSARLYSAAGLPVNLAGIDIRSLTGRIMMDGGARILIVDGEIANITRQTVPVPPVRFSIRNEAGVEIYNWEARLELEKLGPAESFSFRRRLASPPPDSKEVFIRFAARDGGDAPMKRN